MPQAFIILSNNATEEVILEYWRIKSATEKYGDCFLLYHHNENTIPATLNGINYKLFTDDILHELNYKPIESSLVPGSNHFPLLKFYLEHPEYKYYWLIEDDVRFNGNWIHFFQEFNSEHFVADFISCSIRKYKEEPGWFWWNTISHPARFIPNDLKIASFNPIYRISNAALQFIHDCLIYGWCGHHEVLIPTLLHNRGFKLADFGGNGKFVADGYENRFYRSNSPGMHGDKDIETFRFRPVIECMTLKNLLYHPVKRLPLRKERD